MSILYQIWTDEYYIYCATSSGLGVVSLLSTLSGSPESESWIDINGLGAFSNNLAGYSTVWANSDAVFLGSCFEGIKIINKNAIITNTDAPIDLNSYVMNYLNYPDITSDNIRYLHGNNDKLLCITDSGVDVYKMHPQAYRSTSSESNAYKGFMTNSGKFYYTVSGTNRWFVKIMYTCLADWAEPDYEYATGSGVLASGISINDIYVTEGTSSDGISNTLFLATSSGAYVLDEGTNEYAIYYKE
jgi:hypothetical protein